MGNSIAACQHDSLTVALTSSPVFVLSEEIKPDELSRVIQSGLLEAGVD